MKRLIFSSVISVIILESALAEDVLTPFDGFYIGGGLNYSNGKVNSKGGNSGGNNVISVAARGVGFNGFFGYGSNFLGSLYLGAELGLGVDGSRFGNKRAGTANVGNVSTAVRFKSRSNLNYGVAGRLGFIFSSILPYVKVGFEGHGAVKLTTTGGTQLSFGGRPVNIRRNGLLIGGGIDYGLTKNVFVRVEYTHNFGTRTRFNVNGVNVIELKTPTDNFLIGAGYRY